jgi:hypothetical protein
VTAATDITPNDQKPRGSEGPRLGVTSVHSMWYGYTIEAIYIMIGTVLAVTVVGMLIYN